MRPLGLSSFALAVIGAAPALAQAPAPDAAPPAAASADAAGTLQLAPAEVSTQASSEAPASDADLVDRGMQSQVPTDAAHRTGFTAGLRIGVGIPLGNAGESVASPIPGSPAAGTERDLSDLTPVRVPVWLDVGYSLTGALTLGAYGQVGFGASGDACLQDCDWSDIRIGAQAELRLLPGAAVDPWLGIGLGYEWLSYRQLLQGQVTNPATGAPTDFQVRVTERFGGPELLLQGGIDFQVEDALRVGPYASATLAQYLTDSYSCQPAVEGACPSGSSIDGASFHSWIGFGVRGAYTP